MTTTHNDDHDMDSHVSMYLSISISISMLPKMRLKTVCDHCKPTFKHPIPTQHLLSLHAQCLQRSQVSPEAANPASPQPAATHDNHVRRTLECREDAYGGFLKWGSPNQASPASKDRTCLALLEPTREALIYPLTPPCAFPNVIPASSCAHPQSENRKLRGFDRRPPFFEGRSPGQRGGLSPGRSRARTLAAWIGI